MEYDEENGFIGKQRFRQIMKLIKQRNDIPELIAFAAEDPFSETEIENAFKNEYKLKYPGKKESINGKIAHKSVMLICYQIYSDLLKKVNGIKKQIKNNLINQ